MKQVKWGVLGTAGILNCTGVAMAQAAHCRRYAIAGRDPEKLRAYQAQYGFEKGYLSYDALLEDPEVEAVYIPLPNSLHHEWTCKALRHKKHVLCEKPLAGSQAQAREMFAEAEENGVLLMEGFAYLHSPYIAAIHAELEAGTIGKLLYADAGFLTSTHRPQNIRMRRETLGGSAYDLGVYPISLLLTMLGSAPEAVQAVSLYSGQRIDTLTNGTLVFPGGIPASFSCGMVLAAGLDRRVDRLELHGEQGMIRGTDFAFNKSGLLHYEIVTHDDRVTVKEVSVPDNYALEVEQFSRCVLGQDTPLVTKAFSLATAGVIDRILEQAGYDRA